ncbi:hypothetical protein JW935_05100 [candidate division KSB1 bacterium]|nr:hypothetical protein [candidate division KSB1 bacterium]
MKRRQFLTNILTTGFGVMTTGAWTSCSKKPKPNILLISDGIKSAKSAIKK